MIRLKGTRQEVAFVKFHGRGLVDAINLITGERLLNKKIADFSADGGTREIVKEVVNITSQEKKGGHHG